MKVAKLAAVILCVFASLRAVPAQGYSESQPDKPHVRGERTRSVDELKAIAKREKIDGRLMFAYDKFKDESILVGKYESIGGKPGFFSTLAGVPPTLVVVGVEWRFPGTVLKETPNEFALVFGGLSPDWQWFRGDHRIYFLLDDTDRIQLDAIASDHAVKRNSVEESIGFSIPREAIYKIAAARKVEFRIGSSQPITLKPSVVQNWKALADVTQLEAANE